MLVPAFEQDHLTLRSLCCQPPTQPPHQTRPIRNSVQSRQNSQLTLLSYILGRFLSKVDNNQRHSSSVGLTPTLANILQTYNQGMSAFTRQNTESGDRPQRAKHCDHRPLFPKILETPMSPKKFSLSYFLYLFDNVNGKPTVKSPNDGTEHDPFKVALPFVHRMTLEDF